MSVVLDAGAFVAVERGDRDATAIVGHERLAERAPVTRAASWARYGVGAHGRQAMVARLLAGVDVEPIDDDRRIGLILGASGASDVVDAAVVLLADDGDDILTGDPNDPLRRPPVDTWTSSRCKRPKCADTEPTAPSEA